MLEINQTIGKDDCEIYRITDDEDEILKIIKNAKEIPFNGL